MKFYIIITVLLLCLVFSPQVFEANANESHSDGISHLTGNFIYLCWEPEEINNKLSGLNDTTLDLMEETEKFYQDKLFEIEDLLDKKINIELDYFERIIPADKIETGSGYGAGIIFDSDSRFDSFQLQFESASEQTNSELDILTDGNMKKELSNNNENVNIDFEIKGQSETELDFQISGISLTAQTQTFNTLGLSFGPTYFQGSGNVTHESKHTFKYEAHESTEEIDEVLEDLPQESHIDGHLKLEMPATIGWKIGVYYENPLEENITLSARAHYRQLKIDVKIPETEFHFEGEIIPEEYEEENLFNQTREKFEEDFSGMEVGIGINFSF